ncbi:DUF6571 family protein [Acrocarpospora sp. B8E8]|uniref:DUF6571 family protein n=1 Tax=Acrocarpospora sp. B8E8 TaxID=3153572 RepID=UPI00325DFE3E
MDEFEKGLGRAGNTLSANELHIRRALTRLDLDTSGLAALRELQNWISSKRPELRRRNETIQAVRLDWGPGSGPTSGLTAFDEGLYNKAANDPEVYAAAMALDETTRDGQITEKSLTALEKRITDPVFSTTLMYALGTRTFHDLLAKTTDPADDANAQRLQAALGKALATASPRLSTAWRNELTADLSGRHYALSRALAHGTFDAAFLLDVARKIDAKIHQPLRSDEPAVVSPGAFRDSMVGVMTALARDPAAAQDFFTQDPTALKRYMTGLRVGDGKALSAALEAATLTFRDHDGSAEHPSRGYLSAKLTSELIHLESERIRAGDPPKITPTAVGTILAGYITDVSRVASTDTDETLGVFGGDSPLLPERESWGARFRTNDLRIVMEQSFQDDEKAFLAVAGAETVWANKLIDHSASEMAASGNISLFVVNANTIGRGFGFITNAAGIARIREGQERDEAQERNMRALMALVNTGLAIPQTASWPITSGVVGAWTGAIEDAAKGDAREKAVRIANTSVEETQFLIHQLAAQAMLNHGLFGSADPPAKTHPWASLTDLQPGQDPRTAPSNFLKDDGKTLMTRREMLNATDGNPAAYDEYRMWLYQNDSSKTWLDIKRDLDIGFSGGFAKFQ